MPNRDETTPAFGGQHHAVWPTAVPAELEPRGDAQPAADRRLESHAADDDLGKYLSFEEAADEIGGLPEEIREWVHSGAVALADVASARGGRICEQDLRRIERHQVSIDIQRCVKDADKFLDTRFERFGDKTPRELLDSGDADFVRDLVWQIKSGAN